jgi:hypothetical protein
LSSVIAEKLRLNDDTESLGTLDEPDEPDEPLDPLLPQAAASRAAEATTDVRAIFLFTLKSNETTSFVGSAGKRKRGVTDLARVRSLERPLLGKP